MRMPSPVAVCLVGWSTVQLFGAVIGPAKEPYADRADDKPRQHVERVSGSPHEYEIKLGGTVDGVMTRSPIGYGAFVQGWQPNRSVLIENVGRTNLCNPSLLVNGKRNWRTIESIVAEATAGYSDPADRARAIWEFARRHRFHACPRDADGRDAVKVFNVYGYTLCGNQAHVLSDLWAAAGLESRRCFPTGHVTGEAYYDGDYHMFDSDEHVICLERDNRTIASGEEIVRDHDLLKRTHSYGVGSFAHREKHETAAAGYAYDGERGQRFPESCRHRMDLVLRPGESIELRWDHVGKQYSGAALQGIAKRQKDLLAGWGPKAYDNLRNGKLRYRPDLSEPPAKQGTDAVENATFDTEPGCIRPARPGQPAAVTWRMASPYVFVGGTAAVKVNLGPGGSAEWRFSGDRRTWQTIASTADPGAHRLLASLDEVVSPPGSPMYAYWLQLALTGQATAEALVFESDVQTSALSLPELEVGTNRVLYADSGSADRQVRITHHWLERAAWRPPTAPAEAIAPRDGETVEGTGVRFQWTEATDPDGDEIADSHLELSEHADMRWPLSPNFEKLTRLTPSRGKPEWTVPEVGLLNPETTYYWRVRACDATGVWGPWSRTFHFRCNAPGVPLGLKLVADDDGFSLTWRRNPQGSLPVAYKVYGSDEKGFSVSDTEYLVYRGKGFVRSLEEAEGRPADAPDAGLVPTSANLITSVAETRLKVVGPECTLPNTNKAYYRVAAIDAQGNRSGPSDYVEVKRPLVYSRPDDEAFVGQPYRYQPGVIRSLGDLRRRRSDTTSHVVAFWDRQEHTFTPIRMPDGLSMDPKTGLVSGTPTRAGRQELAFEVSDQFGKSTTVAHRLDVQEDAAQNKKAGR